MLSKLSLALEAEDPLDISFLQIRSLAEWGAWGHHFLYSSSNRAFFKLLISEHKAWL